MMIMMMMTSEKNEEGGWQDANEDNEINEYHENDNKEDGRG